MRRGHAPRWWRHAAAAFDAIKRTVVVELFNGLRTRLRNHRRRSPRGFQVCHGGCCWPVFGVSLRNGLIQCAHCVVRARFEEADTALAGPHPAGAVSNLVDTADRARPGADTVLPGLGTGCDNSAAGSARLAGRRHKAPPEVPWAVERPVSRLRQPAAAQTSADTRPAMTTSSGSPQPQAKTSDNL